MIRCSRSRWRVYYRVHPDVLARLAAVLVPGGNTTAEPIPV
ncbi:MAG: hypothetical protein ACRDQ1_16380 [Sciscionella sp.]